MRVKRAAIILVSVLVVGCVKHTSPPANSDSVIHRNSAPIDEGATHTTSTALDVEGTYQGRHGADIDEVVMIAAMDSNLLKIQIDKWEGTPDEIGGVHAGTGTGFGRIANNRVVIVIDSVDPEVSPLGCAFTLIFRAGHKISVKQRGGGSFGPVDASGMYRRVKVGRPKFDY